MPPPPPLPDHLFSLAESLNAHMPLAPGEERIERPAYVVWLGAGGDHPAFTVVQRLRLAPDDVESTVAEVRALLAARGRPQATWEVGPSATPPDLVERLLALGMAPFEEPVATGMVLRRPLPPITSEIVARRVETVEDCAAAFEVLHAVFHERNETPAERRRRAELALAPERAARRGVFLATLDGVAVAASSALYTDDAVVLGGAATLPHARGRGAYRALVAARYAEAVRRGTPTLVIQAGAMSRPILEGLGFEVVAALQVLVDENARGA